MWSPTHIRLRKEKSGNRSMAAVAPDSGLHSDRNNATDEHRLSRMASTQIFHPCGSVKICGQTYGVAAIPVRPPAGSPGCLQPLGAAGTRGRDGTIFRQSAAGEHNRPLVAALPLLQATGPPDRAGRPPWILHRRHCRIGVAVAPGCRPTTPPATPSAAHAKTVIGTLLF